MRVSFAAVLLGVFAAVGLALLAYGLRTAWRAGSAATWPVAEGTLTEAHLDSRSSGESGTTYEIKVAYRYSVAGREYAGWRLAFGYAGGDDKASQERLLAALKGARALEVRYDPSDPEVAALSYGVHRGIWATIALGAIWLAITVGISLVWGLTSRGEDVLLRNLGVR